MTKVKKLSQKEKIERIEKICKYEAGYLWSVYFKDAKFFIREAKRFLKENDGAKLSFDNENMFFTWPGGHGRMNTGELTAHNLRYFFNN